MFDLFVMIFGLFVMIFGMVAAVTGAAWHAGRWERRRWLIWLREFERGRATIEDFPK
jgi:hypothetical protein